MYIKYSHYILLYFISVSVVPEKAYASAVNFYDDLADIAMEKGLV